MKKPKNIEQMNQAWRRLMTFVDADRPYRMKEVSSAFNEMLDGLSDQDFFGTEGQCDPRGDRREYQ